MTTFDRLNRPDVSVILTPEEQRAVWFLGALIRVRAGGSATGASWQSSSTEDSAATTALCTATKPTRRPSSSSTASCGSKSAARRRKDVRTGDYVQIAGGQAHALRNISREPVIELIITNPRLGDWFRGVREIRL